MGFTTDPLDPDLGHGSNDAPVTQNKKYLVLSEEERKKGFIRPVRYSYRHVGQDNESYCGAVTTMKSELAETYACDPKFYGSTYCVGCRMHRPVSEFVWTDDGEVVGS